MSNREMFDERCTILVMGRNASLNMCKITMSLIKKYWEDCPFECVLCTQTEALDEQYFNRVIYTDDHMIWGDRLAVALKEIKTKFVLLLPEDFFLKDYVDSEKIAMCMKFCETENGGAMRLNPPVPFSENYKGMFDVLPEKSIYRITLQPTLFLREYLEIFAQKSFTPWQLEREGTILSRDYPEKTFVTKDSVYNCVHAWSHGMWLKEAYELMEKENIDKTLYCDYKVYPWYMRLRDEVSMLIIKFAPRTITRIRIYMCRYNEKKLSINPKKEVKAKKG